MPSSPTRHRASLKLALIMCAVLAALQSLSDAYGPGPFNSKTITYRIIIALVALPFAYILSRFILRDSKRATDKAVEQRASGLGTAEPGSTSEASPRVTASTPEVRPASKWNWVTAAIGVAGLVNLALRVAEHSMEARHFIPLTLWLLVAAISIKNIVDGRTRMKLKTREQVERER